MTACPRRTARCGGRGPRPRLGDEAIGAGPGGASREGRESLKQTEWSDQSLRGPVKREHLVQEDRADVWQSCPPTWSETANQGEHRQSGQIPSPLLVGAPEATCIGPIVLFLSSFSARAAPRHLDPPRGRGGGVSGAPGVSWVPGYREEARQGGLGRSHQETQQGGSRLGPGARTASPHQLPICSAHPFSPPCCLDHVTWPSGRGKDSSSR